VAHRLERLPQGDGEEVGQDSPEGAPGVLRGPEAHRGGLAEGAQQGLDVEHGEDERQGERRRHHQPALEMVADRRRVARAVGLRDQGVEGLQDAVAEHHGADRDRVADRAGGQRLGREAAEHHGVDHAHQHDAELVGRHGRRQAGGGSELGAEGGAVHEGG
jgi:hypothetical protein